MYLSQIFSNVYIHSKPGRFAYLCILGWLTDLSLWCFIRNELSWLKYYAEWWKVLYLVTWNIEHFGPCRKMYLFGPQTIFHWLKMHIWSQQNRLFVGWITKNILTDSFGMMTDKECMLLVDRLFLWVINKEYSWLMDRRFFWVIDKDCIYPWLDTFLVKDPWKLSINWPDAFFCQSPKQMHLVSWQMILLGPR
jgi:hypothetical protein